MCFYPPNRTQTRFLHTQSPWKEVSNVFLIFLAHLINFIYVFNLNLLILVSF